jgi:uncharacterized membrane protein YedE/YeeE
MSLAATSPQPLAAGSPARLPLWAALGIAFGIVGTLSILAWGPIGVSGTYPRVIGEAARLVAPAYAAANPYLVKMGSILVPETFIMLGLVIGGVLGARVGHTHAPRLEATYPASRSNAQRYRDAFLGGLLIVFGARLAGGCTSGHIISGITQLSVSGFLFAAGVFASGIGTAKLLAAVRTGGR